MPSKGTDRKSFRVEPQLWDEFGDATSDLKDGRSGVLRDFIRWFLKKPGATLPQIDPPQAEDPENLHHDESPLS